MLLEVVEVEVEVEVLLGEEEAWALVVAWGLEVGVLCSSHILPKY